MARRPLGYRVLGVRPVRPNDGDAVAVRIQKDQAESLEMISVVLWRQDESIGGGVPVLEFLVGDPPFEVDPIAYAEVPSLIPDSLGVLNNVGRRRMAVLEDRINRGGDAKRSNLGPERESENLHSATPRGVYREGNLAAEFR